MSGIDWLKEAVDSYQKLLEMKYGIFGDIEKAIEKSNLSSTAGSKAKQIALERMGWA